MAFFEAMNLFLYNRNVGFYGSSRKQLAGAVVALISALVAGCAAGPDPRLGSEPRTVVREVSVQNSLGRTDIRLPSGSPLQYFVFSLQNPERLVVDIADIRFDLPQQKIAVDHGPVIAVTLTNGRPPNSVARLELSLAGPVKFEVHHDADGLLVTVFHPRVADSEIRQAKTVLGLEIERESELLRVVVEGDGALAPKAYLFREKHLVIDFPGVRHRILQNLYDVESPLVERVRIGQHNDPTLVRVVIDLRQAVGFDVRAISNSVIVMVHPRF